MSSGDRSLRYVGRDVARLDLLEKLEGRLRYLGDRPAGESAHA